VPRATVVAQARPGVSGRAGPGPVVVGPCHARAGPKCRATGHMAIYGRALWALGRTGTDDMPGSNPHEVPPPPTGPRLPFAVAGCTVNSNPWAQAHHSPCRSVQNLTLTSPKAESGANLFRKEAPAHRMRWDPKASTKLGSMLPMST